MRIMLSRASIVTSLLLLANFSQADILAKSPYSKQAVQPVKAERVGKDQIQISYQIPPATMFYSAGVNYAVKDGVLSVAIDRCQHPFKNCKPMVKSQPAAKSSWTAKVLLPYHGERVVMAYHDAEEQVYP